MPDDRGVHFPSEAINKRLPCDAGEIGALRPSAADELGTAARTGRRLDHRCYRGAADMSVVQVGIAAPLLDVRAESARLGPGPEAGRVPYGQLQKMAGDQKRQGPPTPGWCRAKE